MSGTVYHAPSTMHGKRLLPRPCYTYHTYYATTPTPTPTIAATPTATIPLPLLLLPLCYRYVSPTTMLLLLPCYRCVPATTLLSMCITVYRFSKTSIVYLLPTICIRIVYSASKLQRTLVCLLVNNKRTQGVSPAFILFLNKHLLSKEVDISISRMCFNPRKHYFH